LDKSKNYNLFLLFFSSTCTGRSDVLRLVLIGETGCGKSTTGNTILNNDSAFISILKNAKQCCCKETGTQFGKEIEVIDTPGIFDSVTELDTFQREIVKCIAMTLPGPTAFLMVVRPYVLTTEQHKAFEKFLKLFGDEIYNHLIIIFTRRKEASENRKDIPEHLRNILRKCNNNLVYFDNHRKGIEREKQVRNLLDLIDNQICKKAVHFNHKFYKDVERIIKKSHKYFHRQTAEENYRMAKREIDRGKGLMLKILLKNFAQIFKAENFNVTEKLFRPISITGEFTKLFQSLSKISNDFKS
jgi:GTPase Era involved in 16S rRNA processing